MKMLLEWEELISAAKARLWPNQYLGIKRELNCEITFLFVIKNGVTTTFLSEDTLESYAKYSERYLRKGFRTPFLAKTESQRKAFSALFEKAAGLDASRLDDGALAELLLEYERCYVPITVSFGFSQPGFTNRPYNVLRKRLSAAGFEDVDAAFAALVAPNVPDVLKREERDLRLLAIRGFDRQSLEKHALKYALLFYNSYDKRANIEYLESRVNELAAAGREKLKKELEESEKSLEEVKKRQAEILAKLDEGTAELAMLLRDLGVDRFELKNTWAGAEYRFLHVFEEVARRIGVDVETLMRYYNLDDMRGCLTGKPVAPGEMKRRRTFYIYYSKDNAIEMAEGDEARRIVERMAPDYFQKHELEEIAGTTACKGISRGKARVVFNAGIKELNEDIARFQEGEILITPMTQPNMVVLAKRAAAIVTDEGGITSHAAVISRELGLPCIVGTRKATKAIKTGDEIEVDAREHEGVVRIISRTGEKPNGGT